MTVSFAQALDMVMRRCAPATPVEAAPLAEAFGRVLGEAVVAPMSLPPADNSAVDGYAFRHAGRAAVALSGFRLAGAAAAGRPLAGAIPSGDAARILTGATLPDGVDSIAMQEDVRVTGGRVFIPDTVAQGANIRRAGEEIGKGQIVLPAGRRLRGADIGLLAALGVQQPPVRKPLRVAVLSAGWELIEAGLSRPAGAIHDANRPALKALLAQLGVVVDDLGIRPDDRGAIRAALAQAAEGNDAIISTAGVSVGDEDHVCAAASELGSLDFRGVAIKPGRPVAFGHIGKAVFFGLPGNPAAMMIAFALLARPGIRRLAGEQAAPIRRYPAIADFALHKPVGRRDVLRCVTDIVDGAIRLRPHRLGGSAILTSIAESDGLVEIAEDIADVAPGDSVLFAPFAEYGL